MALKRPAMDRVCRRRRSQRAAAVLAGWEVARLYLRSKRSRGSVRRRVSGWSHASNLALGRPRTALARRRARTVLSGRRSIVYAADLSNGFIDVVPAALF